jgi:hypothetical protein
VRIPFLPPKWAKDKLWAKAREVPSLDLRFAENKSLVDATTGQNLVTFTRASSGTYVDSEGVIRTATTNEARFDHNPVTGESLGLLVEEQRTNLLLSSEEFNSASWVASAGVTVTADSSQGSPSAFSQVYRIDYSGANLNFSQGVTGVSGLTYTLSIYVKGAAGETIRLSSGNMTGAANFTLTGSWQRISITGTSSSASINLGLSTFGGVTARTVYATASQLEAGAFPTSYIPTGASAVTRSADVCSISGSNFSSWYRQDEGTVFCENRRDRTTGFPFRLAISDGTTGNRIASFYDAAANSNTFSLALSGVAQAQFFYGGDPLGQYTKNAFALKLNDVAVVQNAAIKGSGNSAVIPTVNQISLGAGMTGYFKRLTYWPVRLPDSTLQTITQ